LIPSILIAHDLILVQEQLKKRGVRFGTDLILNGPAKPFIKTAIFTENIRTVVFLNLDKLRSLVEFARIMSLGEFWVFFWMPKSQ
jgi:hypothetical protein